MRASIIASAMLVACAGVPAPTRIAAPLTIKPSIVLNTNEPMVGQQLKGHTSSYMEHGIVALGVGHSDGIIHPLLIYPFPYPHFDSNDEAFRGIPAVEWPYGIPFQGSISKGLHFSMRVPDVPGLTFYIQAYDFARNELSELSIINVRSDR